MNHYYLAVCFFTAPSTDNSENALPVFVELGLFLTHREAFNACRNYADANYAAFVGFRVIRGGV